MNGWLMRVVSGMLVALALAGCGGGTAGQITEVKVVMVDDLANGFQPKTINASPGTIKLTLENSGKLVHDFVIGQLKVNQVVEPGKSQVIQFKADKPGSYEIVCAQPGHKDVGMKGTLAVR